MYTSSYNSTALPVTLVHASDIPSSATNEAAIETIGTQDAPRDFTSVDSFTTSLMRPLFHFTAHDVVIIAMEHNDHSKLLAISTSKNEVYVTYSRNMTLETASSLEDEQGTWDPTTATVLIDQLCYPCTQLAWAPWQHGIYLACVCVGKQVRLYRLSHGRWSLDWAVAVQDCNAVAFSIHFTMACACSRGKVIIFSRSVANKENAWSPSTTFLFDEENESLIKSTGTRSRSVKNLTCVGWNDSGDLLAVGNDEGVLRIFSLTDEGESMGGVVYKPDALSGRGRSLRQVSWAPNAGRSFLILAVVESHRVMLLFLRRPRSVDFHNSNTNTNNSSHGGSGGATSTHTSSIPQLHLIDTAISNMEEVTKLSWNTTGTRFATAHIDSTTRVWAVDVSYQKMGVSAPSGDMEATGGAGTRSLDPNLSLITSIRKVSLVHPYHGGGA